MFYVAFLVGTLAAYFSSKKRILVWLFVGLLMALSFFRYGMGADYFSYQYLYNRLNPSVISELRFGLDWQEPLFRMAGATMKGLGFSYQLYLVVFAAIQLYFIYKICRKYSYYPGMSLLIYYCFYYLVWTFSAIRQGLVLAIGIWSLLELMHEKDQKFSKFLIVILCLSLIHLSALILIPLYFFARIDFRKYTIVFILSLSVCINFIPFWRTLFSFLPRALAVRIGYYVTDQSVSTILDFQSLARLALAFIVLLFWDKLVDEQGLPQGVVQVYLISIAIYFVFKVSELTAARLSIYGRILDIVIFPNIFYSYKKRYNKAIFGIFLLILCALYLSKELDTLERQTVLIKTSDTFVTPYVSIFNKDKYNFGNRYLMLFD